MIIDHHRINKNTDEIAYRENVYIDSSASSASEILTEIITLLHEEDKINNDTAQYLLDGIYLDTNTFKNKQVLKLLQQHQYCKNGEHKTINLLIH